MVLVVFVLVEFVARIRLARLVDFCFVQGFVCLFRLIFIFGLEIFSFLRFCAVVG